MRNQRLPFLPALAILLIGLAACGAPCPISEQEHKALLAELSALKEEVEDLKYGAGRLKEAAEAASEASDFKEVIRIGKELDARHPGSAETKAVAVLVSSAKQSLAEIESERQRAEEARRLEEQMRIAAEEQAKERRIAAATRAMHKSTDEVRGLTFYQHRDSSRFLNGRSDFFLYFATNKEWKAPGPLRLRIQYVADDWLFVEGYTLSIDGESHSITVEYGDVERDNGSGGIWEWYDKPLSPGQADLIEKIIASKKTTLRYNGSQYYKDRTVSENEKRRLRAVLDAYEALGGTR